MSLRQRITDLRRERRIQHLSERVKSLQAQGYLGAAQMHFDLMRDEIAARSAEQVARMERRILKDARS